MVNFQLKPVSEFDLVKTKHFQLKLVFTNKNEHLVHIYVNV